LTKGDPRVDIDANPVACTTPRRRATVVGRWRRRGRFAGAKHLNRGEGKDAGQAHWLGGHEDK
jgi:hypothetical protein